MRKSHWKTENIKGYRGIHHWVRRKLGKASHCSFDRGHQAKRYHWSNISNEYKRELSDWRPLCPSCHILLDKDNKCMRGHEMTPDNTYITPSSGARVCLKCKRNRRKLQYQNFKKQKEAVYR